MKKTISGFLVLFLWASSFQASAENRLALVIGNSDYKTAPLKKPVNDAKDVSKSLKNFGFEVETLLNADAREMEAVRSEARRD
ncbi:MAG: caspase family protein [Methylococcales bacterium]|jgi:uncharacterized caspase-like protein|nr:caspase family protein [Methylococcales bacterium]MBT7445316.1 caspase family protein [Methylococcales bacterium]